MSESLAGSPPSPVPVRPVIMLVPRSHDMHLPQHKQTTSNMVSKVEKATTIHVGWVVYIDGDEPEAGRDPSRARPVCCDRPAELLARLATVVDDDMPPG